MRFCLILAAEILLSAMAVFGTYCAVLLLSENRRGRYRIAINIKNEKDIKTLESMILQADNSMFSSRREKYALLVDYDINEEIFECIPNAVSDRIEIYRHITDKDRK